MVEFDEFLNTLKDGVLDLAKQGLKGFREEALKDGQNFLEKSKEDLRRWTKLLASGELSQEDFEFLVLSKKDVAEMHALKQAGLALVRIDRFKSGLLNLVIETAFDVFI